MSRYTWLKKNNKISEVIGGKCTVTAMIGVNRFEILNVDMPSLNQAFTQISINCIPSNRSDNCNIYNCFKAKDGQLSKDFRF